MCNNDRRRASSQGQLLASTQNLLCDLGYVISPLWVILASSLSKGDGLDYSPRVLIHMYSAGIKPCFSHMDFLMTNRGLFFPPEEFSHFSILSFFHVRRHTDCSQLPADVRAICLRYPKPFSISWNLFLCGKKMFPMWSEKINLLFHISENNQNAPY